MKRIKSLEVVCLSLLMAGVGLTITACSSDDDQAKDEKRDWYADQKLEVVTNHPGTVHYDEELQKWYIDYLQNKHEGDVERFYPDELPSDVRVEGLPVVCSGNIYDFRRSGNDMIPYRPNDYFISLLDIAECDDLQPLQDTESEIVQFLDDALMVEMIVGGGEVSGHCQFNFPGSTLEEMLADTCFVINNQAQLASLYIGQNTIPEIDFSKYTLVIGRAHMPSSGESLIYHDISADKQTLNLFIKQYSAGLAAIYFEYYWGLYPKFEGDRLICKRIISTKIVN